MPKGEVTAVRVAYFETQPSTTDPDGTVQVRLSAGRGEVVDFSQKEYDRLADLNAVQEPGSRPMPGTGPPVPTPFGTPVRDPETGDALHWEGPVMGDPKPGAAVGGLSEEERVALEARARGEGGDKNDEAAAIDERDYESVSKGGLEAEIERRGIGDTVEGTGSGGNVTKPDLIVALENNDLDNE
jgi:hypothetical protein